MKQKKNTKTVKQRKANSKNPRPSVGVKPNVRVKTMNLSKLKKKLNNPPPDWVAAIFLIVMCTILPFSCEITHWLFNIEHKSIEAATVNDNAVIIITKDQLLELMILGLMPFEIQSEINWAENDKNIIEIPQTKSAFKLIKDLYKSGLLPAYVFACPSNSSLDENSNPLAK